MKIIKNVDYSEERLYGTVIPPTKFLICKIDDKSYRGCVDMEERSCKHWRHCQKVWDLIKHTIS